MTLVRLALKEKPLCYVKLHLKSIIYYTHLTAKIQGHWKLASEKTELIYQYMPTFYFRFGHSASRTQAIAVICFNFFEIAFWVTIQWLKLITSVFPIETSDRNCSS